MVVEAATVQRLKRVRGSNMVTPVKAVEVTERGTRHVLRPGVSRIVIDHEWVRARPELFRAVPEADKKTRARHRQMLGSALETLERGRTSGSRKATGRSDMYGLGPRVLPRGKETGRVLPRHGL